MGQLPVRLRSRQTYGFVVDSDLMERLEDEAASGPMLGVWRDSSFLTPEQTDAAGRGKLERED